jgi:hypothetical protein
MRSRSSTALTFQMYYIVSITVTNHILTSRLGAYRRHGRGLGSLHWLTLLNPYDDLLHPLYHLSVSCEHYYPQAWPCRMAALLGCLLGRCDHRVGLHDKLLGVLEAGYYPGCVFLLSCWYVRFEVQKRFSGFYLLALLASGFSNILAWGLSEMKGLGGLNGWQWIFAIVSEPAYSLYQSLTHDRRAPSPSCSASLGT